MMWTYGGSFFGIVGMVLFWGALVALAVLAVRGFDRPRSSEAAPDARHVLAVRFARGEISQDEFEERTRVLDR